MASNKLARTNDDIQRVLANLLTQVKDPRVQQGMISVTRVETTGDLRYSKIWLSVLGMENEKEFKKGLRSASGCCAMSWAPCWICATPRNWCSRSTTRSRRRAHQRPDRAAARQGRRKRGLSMNDREFAAALRDRDAILILSHLRPDGDTLGSGAALCSALRRMGKTAYLFPNPETTARYLPYVAQFLRLRTLYPRVWSRSTSRRRTCFRRAFPARSICASTTIRRTRCTPGPRSCTRKSPPAARRCLM